MKLLKGLLKLVLWVGILGGSIVAIGRFTFWLPGEAPDNAMAPTIWKGDKLIIYTRGKIDRGAIVYCNHPLYDGQVVVGRVVGLPGDTIEIHKGQLRINGEIIFEEAEEEFSYIDRREGLLTQIKFRRKVQFIGGYEVNLAYYEKGGSIEMRKTKVKNGFFLLGDNRHLVAGAADSRNYGEVHPSLCMGRVMTIWRAVKGIGDPDLKVRIFKYLM